MFFTHILAMYWFTTIIHNRVNHDISITISPMSPLYPHHIPYVHYSPWSPAQRFDICPELRRWCEIHTAKEEDRICLLLKRYIYIIYTHLKYLCKWYCYIWRSTYMYIYTWYSMLCLVFMYIYIYICIYIYEYLCVRVLFLIYIYIHMNIAIYIFFK